MKQFAISLTLACTVFAGHAQDLLNKVPDGATAVIKYSGENFGKSVPLQKLDSYGFIRNDLFKMLRIDTLSSMQNTGIDLTSDSYQYVATTDTTTSFVTLVHLQDSGKFLRFINGTSPKGGKIENKNGFRLLTVSDGAFIALNDKMAMITTVSYDDHKNYYSWKNGNYSTADSLVVYDTSARWKDETIYRTDTTIKIIDAEPVPIKDYEPAKSKTRQQPPVKKNGIAPAIKHKPTKKTTKTKTKPAIKAPVEDEDRIEEITEDTMVVTTPYYSPEDSVETMKRELWYQKQEAIKKQAQHDIAEKISSDAFNTNIVSITSNATYNKIIDPAAHVSVWVNSSNLMAQYSRYFSRGFYGMMGYSADVSGDSLAGFSSASNIYFDKDKIRMEQKTYTADPQLAELGKAIMNSKQSESLANYVNPGNIGYMSMSINTEATANYYYRLIKQYLSSNSYMREYKDAIDVYIDFLEIAIDEKALSDLAPGNMMFVMHDLKTKTVSFTDYSYDSEYNRTETKGTRKEISPDFTFVIETKKEDFMQKLARLPLKYAAKEHYQYFDRGGYYEFVTDSSNIVGNLYFMVKDGKALVTTSKEVVDMTVANKGFAPDKDTKRSILENNYSLKLNTSKMLEKLSGEFTTTANKKITDYLIDNIGDAKMESSLKDGMIQSTSTLNIKGSHSNSLEFFFNMIDSINNIIEKDKQDKVNRVD